MRIETRVVPPSAYAVYQSDDAGNYWQVVRAYFHRDMDWLQWVNVSGDAIGNDTELPKWMFLA